MVARPAGTKISIRTRIILSVAGTLVLAQLISLLLIRGIVNENIVNQKIVTADILTTSILHDLKYAENAGSGESHQQIIEKYMTYYRIIHHMAIYDAAMKRVASSDPNPENETTNDREILEAVQRAKPSLYVYRQDRRNLGIRSVSPILKGSQIVGAIAVDLSVQDVQETLAAIDRRIEIIMGLKIVLVSLVLFLLLRGTILQRLQRLTRVTQEIAAGNYDIGVGDRQRDEIGALSQAFDRMTADLRTSKREIENHNQHLEERVRSATAELQKAYEELQSAQGHLVLSEKMASLGALIAGIAHEINTPVGAILNVSRSLEKRVQALPADLPALISDPAVPIESLMNFLPELVASACASQEGTSFKTVRSVEALLREHDVSGERDKASTLCRLNFTDPDRIVRFMDCVRHDACFSFAESCASIAQAARISGTSSQKISEIVRALKYYAYSDKDRVEKIQLNESIQTALVLLRSHLKHAVHMVIELDPYLPPISCTSEIHQIWTNLLTNASDAIVERGPGEPGEIVIRTFTRGECAVVAIQDNGVGIPPDKIDNVFDPFVTTKDIGKGTGLGLSIVTGIVKKHQGTVSVKSRPGCTVFEVVIPFAANPIADPEPDADRMAMAARAA